MNSKRKYLPHFIAPVFFLLVAFLFFLPLFNGKSLVQPDIISHKQSTKDIVDFRKQYHEEPLWTNSMFGGMPAYQLSVIYPNNVLRPIDSFLKFGLPYPAALLFFLFVGFYIFLICLDTGPIVAMITAVGFGLATFNITTLEAGHNSAINAIAYLLPAIGGIILIFREKIYLGFILSTLFWGLNFFANHIQITYYGLIFTFVIVVFYFITAVREQKINLFSRKVILLVSIFIIAVLPSSNLLLCTYESSKYTSRVKSELSLKENYAGMAIANQNDRLAKWSYGIDETMTLAIPFYKGGASVPISQLDGKALNDVDVQYKNTVGNLEGYFGKQPFTFGPVYAGIIFLFLAIIGIGLAEKRWRNILLSTLLITVLFSWGNNLPHFQSFLEKALPFYGMFQNAAMILFLTGALILTLAAIAIEKMIQAGKDIGKLEWKLFNKNFSLRKIATRTYLCFLIFTGVIYFSGGSFSTLIKQNEESTISAAVKKQNTKPVDVKKETASILENLSFARNQIVKRDALRSLILVSAFFIVFFFFLRGKLHGAFLLLAFGILTIGDLWVVDQTLLGKSKFEREQKTAHPYVQTKSDEFLFTSDTSSYRVLNLFSQSAFSESSTSYYHHSIGGYHPAKLRSYQDLIVHQLLPEINFFLPAFAKAQGRDSATIALLKQTGVLNMLNTKYLFVAANNTRQLTVKNPNANGNVWFVSKIIPVLNSDSEMVRLHFIDTKKEAVIQQPIISENKIATTYSGSGKIRLVNEKLNEMEYDCETSEEQFAVFSEIYYPKGWNAYLDNQLVPHVKVNYVLRGMKIPAGKHKIVFKFEPEIYRIGNIISLIGSILLCTSILLAMFLFYRKEKANKAV